MAPIETARYLWLPLAAEPFPRDAGGGGYLGLRQEETGQPPMIAFAAHCSAATDRL